MKSKITGSTVFPQELIEKIIKDSRYSYDMPFFDFIKLVKHYKGIKEYVDEPIVNIKEQTQIINNDSNKSEILDQKAIDDLIALMQ